MRLSELKAGQYCFANGVSGINLREEKSKKDTLSLWPNPAKSEIQVKFPKRFKYKKESRIKLYDQAGREITIPSMRFKEEEGILLLDISSFNKGSYWLDIEGMIARFEKN
jgi:monoamine oxidase